MLQSSALKRKMDSLCYISLPENFSYFSNWPNWIRRFERFRVAAELGKKDEVYQVNSLVYEDEKKVTQMWTILTAVK